MLWRVLWQPNDGTIFSVQPINEWMPPLEDVRVDTPNVLDFESEGVVKRETHWVDDSGETPKLQIREPEVAVAFSSPPPGPKYRWDNRAGRWVDRLSADDRTELNRSLTQSRVAEQIAGLERQNLRALREAVLALADGKPPPPLAAAALRDLDSEAGRLRLTIPPPRTRAE